MCNIPFPYCVQFCWQFFDMPARLDKYLQIICKSWPISTVFNPCHILKWKTGGENAWKIIVSPLHLRPPWSIHLPRFYILEARVLRPLYGLLGESSCRFVGLLCWPLPVALISSSTSQCNALDRLAPHHQLSHHHHHHLRRWFWQNSLRCSPYTSFPAQCSPPSYEEVSKSQIINVLLCCGWGEIGNQRGFETICKYERSKKAAQARLRGTRRLGSQCFSSVMVARTGVTLAGWGIHSARWPVSHISKLTHFRFKLGFCPGLDVLVYSVYSHFLWIGHMSEGSKVSRINSER